MPTAAEKNVFPKDLEFVEDSKKVIIKKTSNDRFLKEKCGFESLPNVVEHEAFFRECVKLFLKEAVFKGTDRKNKVVEWKSPNDLQKLFDFNVSDGPSSQGEILECMKNVIKYSVKTGHPYFVNQLFSSVDPYGLMGQWLGDALNCSVYTYEVAPVFTLMEEYVLREVIQLFGLLGGDGIFCPGGSIANGYAINCARFHKYPQVKGKGLHGLPRLVIFTSNDAHYSIKKMAEFEGIGSDNVYLVETDKRGKMSAEHLEILIQRSLEENATPFMVSATAGTTVLGAFDPIDQVAEICKKYNLWLHVDAAWGGGVIFSKKHRHLLNGIERADSIAWNPHKMLTAPQQCSILLTRHKDLLSKCHSSNAKYLFQKDKFYDTSFDTGDKHIQCGRRADVLKFWIMWKAKGTSGFENHVDRIFDSSRYFAKEIKQRDGFQLVLEEPECTNVCFWYIPRQLRSREYHPNVLHQIAPKMKEKMILNGSMMITYQPLNELPNFFRFVVQNSALKRKDMNKIIDELERLGNDIVI